MKERYQLMKEYEEQMKEFKKKRIDALSKLRDLRSK
jgi:hypothetical protein